jgi:hypothetical protein
MLTSQDILFVLLLSIFSSNNDIDLNTNQNFLLLLLLIFANGNYNNGYCSNYYNNANV